VCRWQFRLGPMMCGRWTTRMTSFRAGEVATSLPGLRVVRVLERLRERRGAPAEIQVDNVLTAEC